MRQPCAWRRLRGGGVPCRQSGVVYIEKQEIMNHKPVFMNRSLSEWFSSLPVFALLLLTLVIGTGEMIHGQLLRMGERFFGDPATGVQYFMLRADPTKPDCDPNPDVEAITDCP